MPNRLTFSKYGKAAEYYRNLDQASKISLEASLHTLRDNPHPDESALVVREFRNPVYYYHFDDGIWKVSFGLSHFPNEGIFEIHVYAIARV